MVTHIRENLNLDDFLACQKAAELLTVYGINPTRIYVEFSVINGDEALQFKEKKGKTTAKESENLQQLCTDLGIAESKGLLIYEDIEKLFNLFNPLIEQENLASCMQRLSHQKTQR